MELIKLKMIVCTLALFLYSIATFGQTWDEFFNQKKTQTKYLLEQLVTLKMYAGFLKKGYDVTSSGINTIKNIKNGEFSLHGTFISSLSSVSPAIRKNRKVADIITWQIAIIRRLNDVQHSLYLSTSNQVYFKEVKNKVMEECLSDMEELLLVITSGKLEMTDDERIKRLEKVYVAMRDKSVFTRSFTADLRLLNKQVKNEQKSDNHLKELYEN